MLRGSRPAGEACREVRKLLETTNERNPTLMNGPKMRKGAGDGLRGEGEPDFMGYGSGLFIERIVAIRQPALAVQRHRNRRRERAKVITSQRERVITGLSRWTRD